jgi:hypothetical protein
MKKAKKYKVMLSYAVEVNAETKEEAILRVLDWWDRDKPTADELNIRTKIISNRKKI